MVSCVLPSRVAWPLDRQTSRNWASKTLGWAGMPSQGARCRQGPKAEILIDLIRFHQFVAHQSGKAHAGGCVLALSLP